MPQKLGFRTNAIRPKFLAPKFYPTHLISVAFYTVTMQIKILSAIINDTHKTFKFDTSSPPSRADIKSSYKTFFCLKVSCTFYASRPAKKFLLRVLFFCNSSISFSSNSFCPNSYLHLKKAI